MSEVKRYIMREWGLPPGRTASSDYDRTFVFAEDYDAAQSELAALREELAKFDEGMRGLACSLGAGGYNAEKLSADQLVGKVQWGIENLLSEFEKGQQNWVDGMKRLTAAEQRNASLEAEIKKLTPCDKCKGKGFIYFTDTDLRNANNGAWGRCLACRPYDVSLTKPTESGASE